MATRWIILIEDYEKLDEILNKISEKVFGGVFKCDSFNSNPTSGIGESGGVLTGETFNFAEILLKGSKESWPKKHTRLRESLIAFLVQRGMTIIS